MSIRRSTLKLPRIVIVSSQVRFEKPIVKVSNSFAEEWFFGLGLLDLDTLDSREPAGFVPVVHYYFKVSRTAEILSNMDGSNQKPTFRLFS
jgi:hypothetical protein